MDDKLPSWDKKLKKIQGGLLSLFLFILFATEFFTGNKYIYNEHYLLLKDPGNFFDIALFFNYFLGSFSVSFILPLIVFVSGCYFYNNLEVYLENKRNIIIASFFIILIILSYFEAQIIINYYNFETHTWRETFFLIVLGIVWLTVAEYWKNKKS